ncbi:MAG TPA: hypothetical protein VNW15_06600 [Rhizomicrobium sp.]|jgi:hypothetical protein|nr:hypothetical protein [Rhizomicrobium sp.]
MEKKTFLSRALAVCPVVAVGLHFILTEWGTQRLSCDGPKEKIVGASGEPLLIFWRTIIDTFGSACGVGFSTTEGLFARGSVAPLAAILGGILIPGLLLAVFFAAVFRRRWALMASLMFAALFSFGILISFDAEWVEYRGSGDNRYLYGPYIEKRVDPPIIATGISRNGCRNCTEFQLWGFYPRENVPRTLAILVGMIAPILLLLTAMFVGLRPIFRRRRAA